jgi:hypothetical protein
MKKTLQSLKYLLCSVAIISPFIGISQSLESLDVEIINDRNAASLTAFSSSRSATCDVDTVLYAINKATGLDVLTLNNATSGYAAAQYFDCPQDITVSGVDFYGYKIDDSGGILIDVNVSVYLAGPDSLPTGSPLSTATVSVDTVFGGGVLSVLRKTASFTPVILTQPYLVVVENNSPNGIGLVSNSYTAVPGDGLEEFLSSVNLFGNWTRSYDVVVGTDVLDSDWVIEPHVQYTLDAGFSQSGGCIASTGGTAGWTNASSSILSNRMYSLAAFLNLEELQYTWDYGDGSAVENLIDGTHTYAGSSPWTVTLSDTLFGWTTTCVDAVSSEVEICATGPANDLCADAISIACGTTETGSTVDATNTDELDNVPGPGVWYVFAGTGDVATVSTDNAGTDYDTRIGYTDACGNPGLAFDEDGGVDFVNGWTSVLTFPTTLGTDYYIYVGGYTDFSNVTATGNFELTVECNGTPVNDNVCDAAPLILGANTGFTNVAATVEVDEPLPLPNGCSVQDGWCDFENGLDNTIWFTFEGPASGNLIVDTDGSDNDTQIAAYSAVACQDFPTGSAVELAANDDNSDWVTTVYSSIVFLCNLTPGETYFLQVDGYNGVAGEVVVNLTETTVDGGYTYVATGLSVDFTDASTTSSTIVSWAWDFGDGNVSTDMSPTHVYAADGSYTACLTVTDENGCTGEYCDGIRVADPVTSIIEALDNGMEVYPNPSNGQFVITVRGVEADAQIVIMDVAGRQVYNEGVTLNNNFHKELNLDIAMGTYLLQIATVEGLVTRKFQVH